MGREIRRRREGSLGRGERRGAANLGGLVLVLPALYGKIVADAGENLVLERNERFEKILMVRVTSTRIIFKRMVRG